MLKALSACNGFDRRPAPPGDAFPTCGRNIERGGDLDRREVGGGEVVTLRRISSVMTNTACVAHRERLRPWRGDRRRGFFGSGPITAA
jgi:hypothetical protein